MSANASSYRRLEEAVYIKQPGLVRRDVNRIIYLEQDARTCEPDLAHSQFMGDGIVQIVSIPVRDDLIVRVP